MSNQFLTRNNVKTTLADNITATTTQFRIFNAASPFRNPPAPSSSKKVRLSIVDSENPSKIEIIEADTIIPDGSDYRLITVKNNDPNDGRGLENSTANSFSAGAIVYMSNTAEMIDAKADREDVIIVSREVITQNGVDYMKVKTSEGNSGDIILFTYEL